MEIEIGDIEKKSVFHHTKIFLTDSYWLQNRFSTKKTIINKIYDLLDIKRVLIKQMLSEEYNTTSNG